MIVSQKELVIFIRLLSLYKIDNTQTHWKFLNYYEHNDPVRWFQIWNNLITRYTLDNIKAKIKSIKKKLFKTNKSQYLKAYKLKK